MKSTVIFKMITMSFLLNLDRVFILDHGTVKEQGEPNMLLTNPSTELYKEVKEVDPDVLDQFKDKVLLGGKKWNSDSETESSQSSDD
jgi:ABC-type proline/glycine betaine transport system ATPase subunit